MRSILSFAVLLVCASILVFLRNSQADPLFAARFLAFDTGASPCCLALGDLDGDHYPDLVTTNQLDNSISVLLGKGDGSFDRRMDFAVGSDPRYVQLNDLNADGRQDIVVCNHGSSSISVLSGTNHGFASKVDYDTGSPVTELVVVDLNLDQWPDLAAVVDSGIAVFLSKGDGTFQPGRYTAVAARTRSIATGYFNEDLWPDLIVSDYQDHGKVVVLLGRGDGGIAEAHYMDVQGQPVSVQVGDLNGDGSLDIVVLHSNSLELLFGDGQGGFSSETLLHYGGTRVAIGNLNSDRFLDLIMTTSVHVYPFLGNGDGTYLPPQVELSPGSDLTFTAIGDLNHDGLADMMTAAAGSDFASVLLGNGDGTFGSDVEVPERASVFVVGSIDRDGLPDLVSRYRDMCDLQCSLGNGNGTFRQASNLSLCSDVKDIRIADFNQDGRSDIAVADTRIRILLGNGRGAFGDPADFPVRGRPWDITEGDFNRDGVLDLAVADFDSGTVSVLIGTPYGSFSARVDYPVVGRPLTMVVTDFDGDRRLDIAVGSDSSRTISVFLGNGDGSFRGAGDVVTGLLFETLSSGDFNNDGHIDLVVAGRDPESSPASKMSLLLGNGNGTFEASTRLDLRDVGGTLAVGDLNGDGVTDLAVTIPAQRVISVLFGEGNGTFPTRTHFGVPYTPDDLQVADLDADGRQDLVVGGYRLDVLMNRGRVPTATWLEDIHAVSSDTRVVLSWTMSLEALRRVRDLRLQRADTREGPYAEVASLGDSAELRMSWEDSHVEAGRTYWYRIFARSADGLSAFAGPLRVRVEAPLSATVELAPPYDAPDGAVQIQYTLGANTIVRLAIFDARGRVVWASEPSHELQGRHVVSWDPRDRLGLRVARGVYFLRLEAGVQQACRKLVLIRP